MSVLKRIEEDYKKAFKEGQQTTVSCLRTLKAAIKNAEIQARHSLRDDEVLKVIASELKKTKESAEAFAKGGRAEQARVLDEQCALLAGYLPEQMSEDELKEIISGVITQTGAAGPADMGKVMGAVMGKVQERADGNTVRQLVQGMLADMAER